MTDLLSQIPKDLREEAAVVLETDPTLARWMELQESRWANFVPRPDRPEAFDQQHSFCYNRDPVAFLIGGNAAGTTEAAAFKTALFVLRQQPPPRKDTPFWIISDTYEQCMGTCWNEKLLGHEHIPDCEIDWDGIRWHDTKRGYPFSVPLKPWPGRPGKNWCLEFKSYKQGRRSMQARSIGGFWFSEQFPLPIFLEVLRGCREYMFPGGQFAEFTPIDPELCIWIEKVMEKPPEGWKFYRANTELNKDNLAEGWYEQFFATVPDELMATRKIGTLATFQGLIYTSFNPAVHVKEEPFLFPPNVTHMRAVDWGASEEHPQTCLWGYQDGMGDWFIYDEYISGDQTKITMDHAVEVLARSLMWGWPEPRHVKESKDPILVRFWELVQKRLKELAPQGYKWRNRDYFGYTYGDPSRPGEMTSFTRYGIQMAPASNDVYQGIDCVRSLFKVNPYSGKPRIYIHPRCTHLAEELRQYRWKQGRSAETGSVLNPEVAKPVPLKRKDDLCFPAGSLVDTPQGPRPIESLLVGDEVWSHLGVATITAASATGIRPIVSLELLNGKRILCTADHPIALAGGGWIRAGDAEGQLVDCRRSEPWTLTDRSEEAESRSKPRSTAGKSGGAIPSPKPMDHEVTFADSNDTTAFFGHSGCTFRCGRITTAQSPRDLTSTTRMEILPITPSTISSCEPRQATPNATRSISGMHAPPLVHGTVQRKAENGIAKMEKTLGQSGSRLFSCANTAGSVSRRSNAAEPGIAPINAGPTLESGEATITRPGNALSAEGLTQSTVIRRRNAARRGVASVLVGRVERMPCRQQVYNLSTSDGTYFVEGVLVSNCDTLRYLVFSPTRSRGEPPASVDQRQAQEVRRSIQLVRRMSRRGLST